MCAIDQVGNVLLNRVIPTFRVQPVDEAQAAFTLYAAALASYYLCANHLVPAQARSSKLIL